MTVPNPNSIRDSSGWLCLVCGVSVPDGSSHLCQNGNGKLQSSSFDFGEKQIFERIATALERIADGLDEIHK